MRWLTRCLVSSIAVFVPCAGVCAHADDRAELNALVGAPIEISEGVEPETQTAFVAAVRAMPAVHRHHLAGYTLRRQALVDLPPDLPLSYRVWAAATLAMVQSGSKSLLVFDAAVQGGPRWREGTVGRDLLWPLLASLSDVLGVVAPEGADSPHLTPAWQAFAHAVARAAGAPLPATPPPVGDAAVFDQLVRGGVNAMLGKDWQLRTLLAHEIGHVVQFGGDHVQEWSRLSAWVEEGGEPADGFVGGGNAGENPITGIRLFLGGERGPFAHYRPDSQSSMVSAYAAMDPREDFAECYRLLLTDPEQLARLAPEKFVWLNATAWSGDENSRAPGPLHVPWADVQGPRFGASACAGLRRILIDGRGSVTTVRAMLGAYAEAIEAGTVLAPDAPIDPWPGEAVIDPEFKLAPNLWDVTIGARTLRPDVARVREVLHYAVARTMADVSFDRGLSRLRGHMDQPSWVTHIAALEDSLRAGDPVQRKAALEKLKAEIASVPDPADRMAACYELLDTVNRADAPDEVREILAGTLALANSEPVGLSQLLDLDDVVEAALAAGEVAIAEQAADGMKGPWQVGPAKAAHAWCAIAAARRRAGDAKAAARALARAVAAARDLELPGWARDVQEQLAGEWMGQGRRAEADACVAALTLPASRARAVLAMARESGAPDAELALELDRAVALVPDARDRLDLRLAAARVRLAWGQPEAAMALARAILQDTPAAVEAWTRQAAYHWPQAAEVLMGLLPEGANRDALRNETVKAFDLCGWTEHAEELRNGKTD